MTYASLALVIVLGSATLLTNDPRFVLAKPAIAHFAIGAIMLKRGWMLRYMPPIVAETIPEYVTIAGYAWAALMFALGCGTIAIAWTGDIKLWAFYVSVVLTRRQARGLRHSICRVPHPGDQPDSRRRAPDCRACHLGLRGEIGYTARRMLAQNHSGFARKHGRPEMAVDGNWNITMSTPMGERKATLTLKNSRRHADGHPGRRRQFGRDLRRHRQRRRPRLESLHHQPDAADAGIHRQGFRRQHIRRNGHRPDGQFSVHGNAGVRAGSISRQVVPGCCAGDALRCWSVVHVHMRSVLRSSVDRWIKPGTRRGQCFRPLPTFNSPDEIIALRRRNDAKIF